MPFQDIESSLQFGRPISFYEFSMGSVVWRYTTAESVITAGAQVWQPAAISDDGVRQTGEVSNDGVSIDAPQWVGPSQLFMSAAPSRVVRVRILDKHEQSPDMVVRYSGVIGQVGYPIPGRCKISCDTFQATMEREGLRLSWQRSCPYALYDPVTCKVSKASWEGVFFVTRIVDSTVELVMTGGPVQAASRVTGYFDNGFIEWPHPLRGVELIAVDSHQYVSGDIHALTLLSDPGELFAGATGKVYRGCSFTPSSCQGFANYDNYGGVPDLPSKSPFGGDPLF
jgi:hypothetical protein